MNAYNINTFPATVVCSYRAEKFLYEVATWSTQLTEEEIVYNFFKRGIEILDKGFAFLENKYPYLAPKNE